MTATDYLVSGALGVAGVVHLLPLSGALSSQRLTGLYGLSFDEPNLAIVMRHRAVLFGLLGGFLVLAALEPAWQPLAFIAGLVSVVSFLWIARSVGGYNARIARVVTADAVVLACLIVGGIARLVRYRV